MNSLKDSEQHEEDGFKLKSKRDQYVYEIRKQKSEDFIKQKRLKLSSTLLDQAISKQNPQGGNIGPNDNQHLEQLPKVSETFQELTQAFFFGVSQGDINSVYIVVQKLRRKISMSDKPPLKEFLETGLFPHLVALLETKYKEYFELQNEVIWIIANAFTGEEVLTEKIASKQLVETLLKYLWHPNSELVEEVFWALGNLSGDSDNIKRMLIEVGVLDEIYKITKAQNLYSENLLRGIVWVTSNLSMVKESHQKIYSLLPILEQILKRTDDEACSYACWAYSNLTNGQDDLFNTILTPGFLKRIVELLDTSDLDIKRPAIRTVGNILSGKSIYTRKMIEAGCIPKLEPLLGHRKALVRKEATWAISNILAESTQILGKVCETGIIPRLLNNIIMDVNQIKLESMVCIINALSVASLDQAESIIKCGVMRVLGPAMSQIINIDLIMAALEVLEYILEHGKKLQQAEGLNGNPYLLTVENEGLTPTIENLQNHQNNEIYKKVLSIIDTYFEIEN